MENFLPQMRVDERNKGVCRDGDQRFAMSPYSRCQPRYSPCFAGEEMGGSGRSDHVTKAAVPAGGGARA